MANACATCGAFVPRGALRCSTCGARFDQPGKMDHLLEGLDELSRSVAPSPVDDHAKAANAALGELETVHADLAKVEPRHADLGDFVRRVAASGATATQSVGPPPRRNGLAPLVVASGVLFAATGLFLTTFDPFVGVVSIVVGLGVTAMGSVLYSSRPVPQ